MRCLVGIDAGVLNQPKSGTPDIGVSVRCNRSDCGNAVEPDIQVARPGNLDRSNARKLIEGRVQFRR